MELAQELKDVLVQELHLEDVEALSWKPEMPLFGPEGLGLDSIDALELVVILKRHFKVVNLDRETGQKAFRTFGTLLDLVRAARNA
jgi:acyl carrier protein